MSWIIRSTNREIHNLLIEESLFFTGNGYLGVRGNFEEGYYTDAKTIRGTYINAFHDVIDIEYGEKLFAFPETQQKLLNIIDTQTVLIALVDDEGEEWFSLFSGEILSYERALYLNQGYTERRIEWRSPKGKEIKLTFKRLVSFEHKELFIQEITIEPVTFYGNVKIVSLVNGNITNFTDKDDPRISSGHNKRLHVTDIRLANQAIALEVETDRSKLRAACAVHHRLSTTHLRSQKKWMLSAESTLSFQLDAAVVFTKTTIFTDSLRHDHPIEDALQKLDGVKELTFTDAVIVQRAYLQRFWQHADVTIQGDSPVQEGIRFNLYHLLQSVGRDSFSNIPAKGLSGEGYEGHYFWDTEIYMFPVFLLTEPKLAKQLLLYRYSTLEHARKRAKEMGHHKGALFPWRTITGSECSTYFPAGTAQYHISADVAYSYIQYFLVTQDIDFMKEFGAEILFETARLWLEIGHYQNGQFRIDAVTGPDEYTCIVNNNYYTNVMAKHNLIWAAKLYRLLKKQDAAAMDRLRNKLDLGEKEMHEWESAGNQMYLPYNSDLDINPQDDTFLSKAVWDFENTPKEHYPLLLHYHPLTLYRYQVCKQADTVLAHFLLEDEQPLSVIENSFNYYEKITTHDSSLSSCIFSIMASKLGYHDQAYQYFIETARLDLDNTHGNTKDGLHLANMGGTWMAIVFGFAGLRIKEKGLSLHPYCPKQWESYSFSLQYQSSRFNIYVGKDLIKLKLICGEPIFLCVFQKDYFLQKGDSLQIERHVQA